MSPWIWLAIVGVAVFADLLLMRYLSRHLPDPPPARQQMRLLGAYSPTLTWLRGALSKGGEKAAASASREEAIWSPRSLIKAPVRKMEGAVSVLLTAAELLVLLLWTLVVTSPYLTLDENVIPLGGEYPSVIQTHHLWTRLRECGACAMWNGSTRGGAPYFIDAQGSMLHPLVIATTLAMGVPNGAKLALAFAFLVAGLAQWWLASLLGLSHPARLWSSMMAVAGGHLAARMELGGFGVVLSLAMCALVLPALIYLFRSLTRRSAVVLGACLALAALAGQGYMQIGMLFSFFPAAILLIPSFDREHLKKLLARLLLAGLIAFLLAAPFLVPFLLFMPNFTKDLDPQFGTAQPLEYLPLNLVIRDLDFFHSESLHKLPFPYLYGNYIGWLALALAACAVLMRLDRERRRAANFLFAAALLAFFAASAIPFKWIIQISPIRAVDDFFAGIRHPSLISGLAAVALIGLAGLGLDQILKFDWPKFQFSLVQRGSAGRPISLDVRWLMLIPLALALWNVYQFGRLWIGTIKVDVVVQEINQSLRTETLEWVNPPFGVHSYIEPAVGMGLKMSSGFRAWNWIDRPFPEPLLEASFTGELPGMSPHSEAAGAVIYKGSPGREYAQVLYANGDAPTICRASGNSGNIDVTCEISQPGTLVAKEYVWNGWYARVDGAPAQLEPGGDWLAVALQPGEHRVEFRYRPWDVPLGIGLWVGGIILAVYLFVQLQPASSAAPAAPPPDGVAREAEPE